MALSKEDQRIALRDMLGDLVGATVTNDAGVITIPADHVLLEVYPDAYQACPLDVIVDMFGDALPDTTPVGVFDALAACDPEGAMGWLRHFERWRDDGLIS